MFSATSRIHSTKIFLIFDCDCDTNATKNLPVSIESQYFHMDIKPVALCGKQNASHPQKCPFPNPWNLRMCSFAW